MTIRVQTVDSRRDHRDFVALPWHIYRDDPHWIPPLRVGVRHQMHARKNPFHAEATVQHFLARDQSGRAVGRIAGVVHPSYVQRHGPKAFFGMFECIADDAVAQALLGKVEQWAMERGFEQVVGPYSYSGNQDVGVLVDGFERPPTLMQSHNPPYYHELLQTIGYKNSWEAYAYRWTRAEHGELIAELTAIADRINTAEGFRVRSVDLSRFDEETAMLRRLYNAAFAYHPESTPLSPAVFQYLSKQMKPFVDPELIRIIEREGEPVAFALLMPDLNRVLSKLRGRVSPGLLLRPRHALRDIREVVVVMIGAAPEALGVGLGQCLRGELIRAAMSGPYDTVHTTWIHEANTPCRAISERLGAPPVKTYVVMERAL